jgi:hypothetical protein
MNKVRHHLRGAASDCPTHHRHILLCDCILKKCNRVLVVRKPTGSDLRFCPNCDSLTWKTPKCGLCQRCSP